MNRNKEKAMPSKGETKTRIKENKWNQNERKKKLKKDKLSQWDVALSESKYRLSTLSTTTTKTNEKNHKINVQKV